MIDNTQSVGGGPNKKSELLRRGFEKVRATHRYCYCDGFAMAICVDDNCVEEWREVHAFVELEGRSKGAVFYDFDEVTPGARKNVRVAAKLNAQRGIELFEKAVSA